MTQLRRPSEKSVRVALVTGANRGIGFEVSRQLATRDFVVLLTARDLAKARAAAENLSSAGRIDPLVLDVANADSIAKGAHDVASRYGHLDVLVNNAGINYDTWETAENADIDGTVVESQHEPCRGLASVSGISAAAAKEQSSANRQCVIRVRIAGGWH